MIQIQIGVYVDQNVIQIQIALNVDQNVIQIQIAVYVDYNVIQIQIAVYVDQNVIQIQIAVYVDCLILACKWKKTHTSLSLFIFVLQKCSGDMEDSVPGLADRHGDVRLHARSLPEVSSLRGED